MLSQPTAGVNGFGRFGLHLLRYWLTHIASANFTISYINDDTLTPLQILSIIQKDPHVRFDDFHITLIESRLSFATKDRTATYDMEVSRTKSHAIPWLGIPRMFLECSGKHTNAATCAPFLVGDTAIVLISATSHNADATRIYGHNHTCIGQHEKIISYGSCTVNAYVPLAAWIDTKLGIVNSDVSVIHSVPEYKLQNSEFQTPERRSCTLEHSAPKFIRALKQNNFRVNYTLIPYTGVSFIDIRFQITRDLSRETFVSMLKEAFETKPLQGLYSLIPEDSGPRAHRGTSYNVVFIESLVSIKGGNLYLCGYFDNENSAARYFDLANDIAKRQFTKKIV